MYLFENAAYLSELERSAQVPLPWEKLNGRTLAITGATGLLGRFLVDLLAYRNRYCGGTCTILAVSRSEPSARQLFAAHWTAPWFMWRGHDVTLPFPADFPGADYYIHAASNTHPVAYATDPIGTIAANVTGTGHLLDAALRAHAERFLFVSSVEVYGESRAVNEIFSEHDIGYLDCNTLRAGYPESKRVGEALVQAYRAQHGLEGVVIRLPRVFGPTVRPSDSKASSQFLRCAQERRDIVLKSPGTQFYSYLYVPDAVSAMLTVLLSGKDGDAYNAADARCDVTLRDFAQLCADWAGTKVVFALPDDMERAGYSTASRAVLNAQKLRALGWRAEDTISSGIEKTLHILSAVQNDR